MRRAALMATADRRTVAMGAAMLDLSPPKPRAKPLPHGTKMIRVGDQDVPLTRGERKRVLRKLLSLKVAEGKDANLGTPSEHANRRSERCENR